MVLLGRPPSPYQLDWLHCSFVLVTYHYPLWPHQSLAPWLGPVLSNPPTQTPHTQCPPGSRQPGGPMLTP